MTVEIRQAGPQDVVAVMPAEVDCTNAAEVREVLLRTLNGTARTLTIDMSATTFCDVAGVRAIERAYQRARACDGTVRRRFTRSPIGSVSSSNCVTSRDLGVYRSTLAPQRSSHGPRG
jgi:hypothetical protein